MGERADGTWAARFVGVSAPRQQGKSQLIVARALAGILLFGEQTILLSAHQQDTAREVFTRMVDILESTPSLNDRVEAYGRALNREYIRFRTGQVIRFKARSKAGGGRGFSASLVMADEAQIFSPEAWGSLLPTLSAMPNPQVWLLGTPPTPMDDGEVFGRIRENGITGKDKRLAYLEWSADEGDDLDDHATWAKANPAFGTRISVEAIESERAAMSDQQFAMERLGMWSLASVRGVIPFDAWADRRDDASVPVDALALGVEVAPDLASASVGLAGRRADGEWHVELDEHRTGAHWLDAYVGRLVEANPGVRAVVVDVGGPVAALLEEHSAGWRFRGSKVRVQPLKVKEIGTACTRLLDGVVAGGVSHIGQPQLDAAVQSAAKRALGDTGMWTFSRKNSTADITPVQAVTWALAGAQAEKVTKRPVRRGRENDGSVVVL